MDGTARRPAQRLLLIPIADYPDEGPGFRDGIEARVEAAQQW